MNGFEIGMALLAVAFALVWLNTPDVNVLTQQERVQREADAFRKAMQAKHLAQQKEHGRRVEARRKANG